MAERATITDTPNLARIIAAGRERGYNRQPSDEVVADLDPEGTHVVMFAMPHEHIAGERVEGHWRTIWMLKLAHQHEPLMHVGIDMSDDDYASLTRVERVNGEWEVVGAAA